MNAETFIAKYTPCQKAVDWLRENNFATIEQAWKVCERGDWMVWTLQKMGYADERAYRLMAADFAKHVLPIWEKQYPNDDRPRKATQAARDFADAADADAADADAYAAERAWQANKIREYLPTLPEVQPCTH